MLLLHTADVHLGARFMRMGAFGARAREAVRASFKRACDLAVKRRVDAVVIAGNLFDSADPPSADMACVGACLEALSGANVPVLVLPGTDPQHDPPDSPLWRKRFPRPHGVHLLLDEEPVVLPERGLVVHPRLAPPVRFAGCRTGRAGVVEVGVAHGDCLGLAGGAAELSKEDLEASGLDYVALGHYHRPFKVAGNAWYSGSPGFVALDQAGRGSVFLVEAGSGAPRVEKVPVSPLEALEPRELHPALLRDRDALFAAAAEGAAPDAVALIKLIGEAEEGLAEWLEGELAGSFAWVGVEDGTVPPAGPTPQSPLEGALIEAAARRGDEEADRALSYLLSLLRGHAG